MRLMKLGLAAISLAALVVVIGCGGNSSPVAATPPPAGGGGGGAASVSIANLAFAPTSISVKAGQSVTWQNNDTTTHTATADGGAFDTGAVAPGASRSATMNTPGTFSYHCTIHPFMTASVTVTQ